MPNTGVYARISLDRDGDALGVERQVTDAGGFARGRKWKVTETYIDNDRSAYSGRQRPEWERLLADLEDGKITHVVAWANDRLYRRTRDQLALMEAVRLAGGIIATLKDGDVDPSSAEGRMRMGILANVAEFESARKAERVSRASEQRAASGKPHGRPSFGWRSDGAGDWVLDPPQAKLVREAAKRILHGESTYAIITDWNAHGVPTGAGASKWSHQALIKILRRPANAGLRVHRDQVVGAASWPALLDMEDWESVVARIAGRGNRGNQARARRYLLTGVVHCTADDRRMVGHHANFRSYHCYECGRMITADRLDTLIIEALLTKLSTPRLAERLAHARNDSDEAKALRDLERADARLSELAGMFGSGDLDTAEYRAGRLAAQSKRTEAERRLSKRRSSRVLVEMVGEGEGIREVWGRQPATWRRELVAAVIDRITIGPSTKPAWEPSRVEITWRTA